MCPVPLASCVAGVAVAFAAIAAIDDKKLPSAEVLGERAALAGLQRNGAISPGGGCRLLRAADGWLAISLPRDDDWELMPAWLEAEFELNESATAASENAWEKLGAMLLSRAAQPLVDRARLLGLAAACVDMPTTTPTPWYSVMHAVTPRPAQESTRRAQPLVIDLSSLWAGPLCSHLLQIAGAQVVKVESRQRPDGARNGPPEFYDLMNFGKASVALDFSTPHGVDQLRSLLLQADIVIEASRPRALQQLGIDAHSMIAANPGLTWISITGYGRDEPQANWIAYGDDAGVAAGLSGLLLELCGEPLICGDAIADPLTGWHAALAALASYRSGGGRLIALALRDVVAHCNRFRLPDNSAAIRVRWREWQHIAAAANETLAQPVARQASGRAQPLGADTAAILMQLGIPC